MPCGVGDMWRGLMDEKAHPDQIQLKQWTYSDLLRR